MGSIGLVLAIPLTTAVGVLLVGTGGLRGGSQRVGHERARPTEVVGECRDGQRGAEPAPSAAGLTA